MVAFSEKCRILNDNHGGPYHPPGLRMLDALGDVRESLAQIASSARTGPAFALLNRLQEVYRPRRG